ENQPTDHGPFVVHRLGGEGIEAEYFRGYTYVQNSAARRLVVRQCAECRNGQQRQGTQNAAKTTLQTVELPSDRRHCSHGPPPSPALLVDTSPGYLRAAIPPRASPYLSGMIIHRLRGLPDTYSFTTTNWIVVSPGSVKSCDGIVQVA